MRKLIIFCCLVFFLSSGCSSVGKATGKTVKGVENAADDFKEGYRQGRGK